MTYVLDAGPMIALLNNEPGAGVTENILTEPGGRCYAHIFNLTEVYYIYYRNGGLALAESALQDLLDAGIVVRDDADAAFWKDAATIKGSHPLALPDAFCLALARRLNATAVTTDHKEFDPLVAQGLCPILFVR